MSEVQGKQHDPITKDILLRALLFALVFYVINDSMTSYILKQYIPIPVAITQTLLFTVIYIAITVNL
jgi:hypothetical protein